MFAADPNAVIRKPADDLQSPATISLNEITGPVEPFLEAVNRRLISQVDTFEPDIVPYADYALKGQGKHLRPILVALTANGLGRTTDAHVTVAVIIEMVHLATLVHDDVMDEAEIRRGRLTLGAHWGNEIAVLFGDCLFAQALKLAASFPTPEVCRAVAMATNTVCSGEILQTQHRKDFDFSGDRYFRVLEMKTAELFALSCDLSGLLSGASPETRTTLRQFGLGLGTAYQLYDDCIDVFGSETVVGKSLGTDLAKGKLTLPILQAWEAAGEADRARLKSLVENWETGALQSILELLSKYDTLNRSLEVIRRHYARARQGLLSLPENFEQSGLQRLTDYFACKIDSLAVYA
jgi:octaprenyl-diphosphate synthase